MRFGGIVVQLDGLLGCRLGLGPRFAGGEEAFVVAGPEVRIRQSGECRRKRWTQPDGFLELRDRFLQVLVARAVEEISTLEIRIVRLGIHARRSGQPRLLARGQLHVDLPGDGRRQFRLQRQHIARAALEALGPEMLVRPRVDQLRRDPHLVAGSRHRSFHDRVDVELPRDVRRRRPILAFELHHRAARDDAKLADGCEVGGQFVGHPFGEVVLAGIARVVVERKHGNRSNDSRGARRSRRRAQEIGRTTR